jgi:hypothetical protein
LRRSETGEGSFRPAAEILTIAKNDPGRRDLRNALPEIRVGVDDWPGTPLGYAARYGQ